MSSFRRVDYTRKRRSLSPRQRNQQARHASFQLRRLKKKHIKRKKGNIRVGLYYDGFGELPTQPILDWCHNMGYQAYLPVVGSLARSKKGSDKRLRFSPIYHKKLIHLPTHRHPLGMRQHHHRQLLWTSQLDVIFCPLVAINQSGNRVGMGGGYYDRTFAKAHKFHVPKPIKVGWCYDFQLVHDDLWKPMPWDVPMDFIMTPNQCVRV